MKTLFTITVVAVVVLATYTVYRLEIKPRDWDAKINRYKKAADSLSHVVRTIDASVKKKDSIMLNYMSSLTVTLHELNKETLKNKTIVTRQLSQLDSSRLSYCRELAKLGLKPNDCE
ncbi:MAG: hypothetical protein JSS79_16775 [Bacteroidetes bacterium]|nr:hypothetical protein [Bacteroidota bacterium]